MDLNKRIRQLEFLRKVSLENNNFKIYVDNFFRDKASQIYHSNKIEGSTVTFSDTIRLLKGISKLDTEYSKREIDEVDGLNDAVDLLYSFIKNKQLINVESIRNLHSKLYVYNNIDKGEYRMYNVTSNLHPDKEIYLHHEYISEEMESLIHRYNKEDKYSGIEKVINLKLDFIMVHPFRDGNGRTSRLLLNWALIQHNFIPINILANDRENYISIMEKCRVERTNTYLLDYVLKHLEKEYRDINKWVKDYHINW